ncbi:unnamed protein product [Echinostoma caproni]|uniref:VWFA domain-containing protein n=1 Tax=Echinostoma caproni TaxID=27848 RepID=A0A183AYR3_9TREM|nr:unnamed protein product [Echinostoma caproni]
MQYQKNLEADLGGTEVYPALEEAFQSPLTGKDWYKQIIFFTDGDVNNADEVILFFVDFPRLPDDHSHSVRVCFSANNGRLLHNAIAGVLVGEYL